MFSSYSNDKSTMMAFKIYMGTMQMVVPWRF